MPKADVQKSYFAQVGRESIAVDAEHVALQREGAAFSTSAPVLFYRVVAMVGEQRFEAMGQTWDEAEESVDEQIGALKP